MRGKQFTEEQIIGVLKEADAGMPLPELLRKHGIAQGTFYRWKAKYGGMDVSDAKRLKATEEENRRLKRIVADQALDIQMLKDVLSKNGNAQGTAGRGTVSGRDVSGQCAAWLWVDGDPPPQFLLPADCQG